MKEEYWQAIVECDRTYDGEFFYGVVTTGIFCRPSCKSREPKRENVRIYGNQTDATQEGLRACKRCRPDLLSHASAHSTQEELVQQVQSLLAESYAEDLTLEEIARRVFVSPFYLQRVFKQATDQSPAQFLMQKRMEAAKLLLKNSSLTITDIALQVGFKNPAHFSSVFYKEVGHRPSSYRLITK